MIVASLAADQDGPPTVQASGSRLSGAGVPGLRAFDPLATFAVIAQRPLLSPSRRLVPPPAAPIPPAAPAAAPPALQPPPGPLLAVLIGPGQRSAVLRLPDGHVTTVTEGKGAGEWTLEQVLPDRVRLRAGANVAEVAFPAHSEAASVPARAVAGGPAAPLRRRR